MSLPPTTVVSPSITNSDFHSVKVTSLSVRMTDMMADEKEKRGMQKRKDTQFGERGMQKRRRKGT